MPSTNAIESARPSPGVSVVIPSFNAGLLLYRAVKSVLEQSAQVAEIIVVDDASTDGSCERAESYFPQIKVIRLEQNSGVSRARNVGVENARGDWIAFLDADDTWLPQKVELQIEALERSGADMSLGGFLDIRETTRRWGRPASTRPLHEMLCHPVPLNTSTLVLRRALFLDCGGYRTELRRGEDIEFYYRLALSQPLCQFVHTPLARYHHDNPESLTRDPGEPLKFSQLQELLQRHVQQRDTAVFSPVLQAATVHFRTKAYSMMAQGLTTAGFVDDLLASGDSTQLRLLRAVSLLPPPLKRLAARATILPTRYRQGRLPAWRRR